ncbi:MAG: hypothetical protein PHH73_00100 [Candidatus Rickettsiella isopodorum]|nr:hypothetical protein [Candidatus Rickettsiella isopodorum]
MAQPTFSDFIKAYSRGEDVIPQGLSNLAKSYAQQKMLEDEEKRKLRMLQAEAQLKNTMQTVTEDKPLIPQLTTQQAQQVSEAGLPLFQNISTKRLATPQEIMSGSKEIMPEERQQTTEVIDPITGQTIRTIAGTPSQKILKLSTPPAKTESFEDMLAKVNEMYPSGNIPQDLKISKGGISLTPTPKKLAQEQRYENLATQTGKQVSSVIQDIKSEPKLIDGLKGLKVGGMVYFNTLASPSVKKAFVKLKQGLNDLVYLKTGANLNEQEQNDAAMNMLPALNDKPEDFVSRLTVLIGEAEGFVNPKPSGMPQKQSQSQSQSQSQIQNQPLQQGTTEQVKPRKLWGN